MEIKSDKTFIYIFKLKLIQFKWTLSRLVINPVDFIFSLYGTNGQQSTATGSDIQIQCMESGDRTTEQRNSWQI